MFIYIHKQIQLLQKDILYVSLKKRMFNFVWSQT